MIEIETTNESILLKNIKKASKLPNESNCEKKLSTIY